MTEETRWIMERHPTAFLLLAQIAVRAKWSDCPLTGLKAGQALIGDFKTAGIDTKAAYRAAKERLESLTLATFRGTPRGTVATLTSSRIFETLGNPSSTQDDTPTAPEQHTNRTQNDAIAAPNIDRDKEAESERDLTQEGVNVGKAQSSRGEFPAELSSDAFREAWREWEQHRREKKNAITPTARKQQLQKLAEMGEQRAIEAIRHSISNGWTGIFEVKQNGKPAHRAGEYPEPPHALPDLPDLPPIDSTTITAEKIASSYPRREATAECLKIISGHIEEGDSPEAILAGTRAIAAVMAQWPSGHLNRYGIGAARFFREKRWQDDPSTWLRQGGPAGTTADGSKLDLGGRRPSSVTHIPYKASNSTPRPS